VSAVGTQRLLVRRRRAPRRTTQYQPHESRTDHTALTTLDPTTPPTSFDHRRRHQQVSHCDDEPVHHHTLRTQDSEHTRIGTASHPTHSPPHRARNHHQTANTQVRPAHSPHPTLTTTSIHHPRHSHEHAPPTNRSPGYCYQTGWPGGHQMRASGSTQDRYEPSRVVDALAGTVPRTVGVAVLIGCRVGCGFRASRRWVSVGVVSSEEALSGISTVVCDGVSIGEYRKLYSLPLNSESCSPAQFRETAPSSETMTPSVTTHDQ